jgi:hypothetical protein
MKAYIKQPQTFQINSLMMHLELLQKQEHAKLQISKWKEIIKNRAEINKIETKRTIQRKN